MPWLSDIPVKHMVTGQATVLEKQGGTGKQTGNIGVPEKRQTLYNSAGKPQLTDKKTVAGVQRLAQNRSGSYRQLAKLSFKYIALCLVLLLSKMLMWY